MLGPVGTLLEYSDVQQDTLVHCIKSNLHTLVKFLWLVLLPSAYHVEHFTHSASELYFLGRVGHCAAWEQCREQERAARVHNLADLLWSCRSMLHNALSSLSTDPDQIVHEQKTNIRGGRSSATSLCTCTSDQNNSTLPQTKLLLADSLRRFKVNLVQQIAINFDFVHWKNDTVLNCKFRNASSALWHYSEQSTNFTIKYRHNLSAVRNKSRDGGSAKDHNNAKYSSAPPANPQWGWLGTLEGTKTQFSPQTLCTTSALRLPLLTICTTS